MIRVYFVQPIRLTSSDLVTSVFCQEVTLEDDSVTLNGVTTLVSDEGREWDADSVMVVFNFNIAAIQHISETDSSPDERKDVWQFLIGDLRKQRQFVDDQQRIGGWLREAQARWEAQEEAH